MTIEENVKKSTTKGKNILIVDDESDITFTIKNILEDNGFQVDSFTDSISALDNYQNNFYDLVIGLRVEVHDFL